MKIKVPQIPALPGCTPLGLPIPASAPDPIPAETVARRPPAHDPCEADKQEQEDRWL